MEQQHNDNDKGNKGNGSGHGKKHWRSLPDELRTKPHKIEAERAGGEPHRMLTGFWASCTAGERYTKRSSLFIADGCEAAGALSHLTVYRTALHSTSMKCLQRCRRKFFYHWRLGLEGKHYMPAFCLGKAYHLIMEALYAGVDQETARMRAVKHYEKIEDVLTRAADAAGLLPGGKPLAKVLDDMNWDLAKAQAMALWAWRASPFPLDRFSVVTTEQALTLKYKTIVSPLKGTVDLLLRKLGSNDVYIVDHKTTSFDPKDFCTTLKWDVQTRLYRLLTEAYLQSRDGPVNENGEHFNLRGVYHCVIRKPTKRLKIKQTFEEYLQEIADDYQARLEAHRTDPSQEPPFVRSLVRFTERTPLMPEELLIQLRMADRAHRAHPNLAQYDRDPTGNECKGFGGRSKCPFFDLCDHHPAEWPDIIEGRFKQCDPETRYEEDD